MNKITILLVILLLFVFFVNKENFVNGFENNLLSNNNQCLQYGDDYNACYSNPSCTIWFRPDGSTYCTKKFLQENI